MLDASEMRPMIDGKNAPPRIAMTRSDEPRLVSAPRFLMLNAKMVGNMMEWKNPMKTTAQTDIRPVASKATMAQISEAAAKRDNNRAAAIFFIRAEPMNRPAMNPIWCSNKYSAAVFSGVPGTETCAYRMTKL